MKDIQEEYKNTEKINNSKLENIGILASGIAHEISSPIQFVASNIEFIGQSMEQLIPLISDFDRFVRQSENVDPDLLEKWNKIMDDSQFDFIKEEIPEAIEQSIEGVDRIIKIVMALKNFTYREQEVMSKANLNEAIDSTMTISKNEWKYSANLRLELEQNLPYVTCYIGDINQVILNLIINAAHAIEDLSLAKAAKGIAEAHRGEICIRTYKKDGMAVIKVSDNGIGIDSSNKDKIYEPFFTTKTKGRGTGQGLSISKEIIEKRHHGKLYFESSKGQGTSFYVEIPFENE